MPAARFSQRRFLQLATMALLSSCTPYQVRTDYDHEVAFESLRTFAWMDSTRRVEEESGNPFLERRVRRAVELAMRERGLTEAGPDRADMLVTAFVIGPTRGDRRAPRWSAFGCGPAITVRIGPRYPFGYSRRRAPWFFPSPFWADPWGYACTYRIGYGYVWLPLYEAPGQRLEGTLVVDILDRRTHELLWRGTAEGALIDPRVSNQPQEEIDRIVREILRDFPPR